MRIAVTYENGQIFQHFGHTETFKIYTVEGKENIPPYDLILWITSNFESLDELKQPLDLVKEILNDEAKVNAVNTVLNNLASLDLFNDVAVPAANSIVAKLIAEKAPNFDGILDLTQLSEEECKNDFADLILIAQNVYEICGFNFTLADINFTKVGGDLGTDTIALLFGLNLLDDDEAKNNLVLAALKQFKVINEENLENVDLSEVVWTNEEGYSEVANLQTILTIVGKMSRLEGVDINNGSYDLEMILNNDETYEYVVDLLDVVVDSKLMLELLPSALQQFVVPLVKDADDEDGTLNDVITGLESSELIKEVQKLIDVAQAVVELNVLKVKEEGIQAIDLAKTEAIKTIINGIFDSKILEGYEGRLVRILLRATNIFPDLEKGAFDHVDFDREQSLLISAIDELEVVLQDENFLTFDENNKIKLDKEYYLQEETLDAFLNTLKALLGEYDGEVYLDPLEASEYKWISPQELADDLTKNTINNLKNTLNNDITNIINGVYSEIEFTNQVSELLNVALEELKNEILMLFNYIKRMKFIYKYSQIV